MNIGTNQPAKKMVKINKYIYYIHGYTWIEYNKH